MTGSPAATPRHRLLASAGLVALLLAAIGPAAAAGPIANSFKQWSMQRQTNVRVDKPFSHQSGRQELNAPSALHRLRMRLTGKSQNDPNGVRMSRESIHLNQGTLYR